MKPRLAASAIAAAILGFVTGAHAEPAARLVYLRGKGTESCPDETELRAAVQTRLGYDPFNSYASSTMFAEVSATDSGFAATLKLVDADNAVKGDRALKTTGKCSELTDAMALTISLAIDPMSVTRTGPPPDAPPEERPVEMTRTAPEEPPPEPAPSPPPAPTPPPVAPRPRPVLAISLGPYASLGSAPALSVGAALAGDVQYRRFFGGVEVRGELPASASAGALGRVGSHLYAAALYAGAREGPFFAAAIVAAGSTLATSSDTASSRDESALYLSGGLRLGAGIRLSERFEVRVRGDMLANVVRNTLAISGQKAYEYPAIAGDLGIVAAVRFP